MSRKEYLLPALLGAAPLCLLYALSLFVLVSENFALYTAYLSEKFEYVFSELLLLLLSHFLFFFPILIPLLILIPFTVRRLHDIGWSGWLAALLAVSWLNVVLALVEWFAPDTGEWFWWLFAISVVFSLLSLVFILVLLRVPGAKEANMHGSPPRIDRQLLYRKNVRCVLPFFLAVYLIILCLSFVVQFVLA